ncbi:MAG: molecular chaperone TorD family protein [Caldilineaceae bacterium]|nr:molecular chaperone TorD family protein [Caldilineaceae bacterium]MCB9137001.1 molecular chaperone TorD family protein [Caldilineaceae bacterium]
MNNNTQAIHHFQPADQLTAFSLAFGFLHKVFYEPPTAAFVTMLADDALFDDWPLGADNAQTLAGLTLLQAFTSAWEADQLPALQHDFARLFVGPDRLAAPPWESVYLSQDGLLFEAQTLAVRDFYRRFDLRAPNFKHEPDDHIGLELAFMAHLNTLGLAAVGENNSLALENSLDAQRDFLEEHLLRWAPQFCQDVIAQANTPFFRGTAHLTLGALESAAQAAGATVGEAAV